MMPVIHPGRHNTSLFNGLIVFGLMHRQRLIIKTNNIILDQFHTKAGKISMMNDSLKKRNLVEATSDLCQWNARETITSKTNLEDWIKITVSNVRKVVPSKFWFEYNLDEPGINGDIVIARFCKESKCPADSVIDLVLWSRCSRDCYNEIKTCLNIGAKQWCFEEHSPEHYIHAYTFCVKTHAGYSMRCLGKAFGDSFTQKSKVEKEAYCMHQAVMNSSAMFRTLTSQAPNAIISAFIKYLRSNSPESQFRGKTPSKLNWSIFTNDTDKVAHVSILSWLKKAIIIPKIKQVLRLPQLAETQKELAKIESERGRVPLKQINHLGEGLLEKLQIDCSGHRDRAGPKLIATVLFFSYLVKKHGEDSTQSTQTDEKREIDEHMMKLLFKSGMIAKGSLDVVLKNLAQDPELFPCKHSILSVVSYFPRVDDELLGETVYQVRVDQEKGPKKEKKSGKEREQTQAPQTRSAAKRVRDKGKTVRKTATEDIKGNEKKENPKEVKAGKKKGRKQNNKNARVGETRGGTRRGRSTAANNPVQSKKKQKTGMNTQKPKEKSIAVGEGNESTVQFSSNTEV